MGENARIGCECGESPQSEMHPDERYNIGNEYVFPISYSTRCS
jgi:hypothetical protein